MSEYLSVCHTTLQEEQDRESTFPLNIRNSICQAITDIPIDDIEELFNRHESDPENFDERIENNLKTLLPGLSILTNHRISEQTKFDNDLLIEDENTFVCLEIEKGNLARFEFDILKMQAFASSKVPTNPSSHIYGGFIVPADNVVARHIAGNPTESSYKYLCRLSHLIAQIGSFPLKDILIVGYIKADIVQTGQSTKTENAKSLHTKNNVIVGTPLLEESTIQNTLQGYPLDKLLKIRKRLLDRFPGLHEKLNCNGRYFGYALDNQSDALYVYVQKKQLLLDIKVSKDEAEHLRSKGYKVTLRDNYQGQRGWLTGVCIPHEAGDIDAVVDLAVMALEG